MKNIRPRNVIIAKPKREQFSVEWREIETKVITLVNRKGCKTIL